MVQAMQPKLATTSRQPVDTDLPWRVLSLLNVFRLLLPLVTGRPLEALRLTQVHDLARLPAPEGCVLVSSPAQLARLPSGAEAGSRILALLSAEWGYRRVVGLP